LRTEFRPDKLNNTYLLEEARINVITALKGMFKKNGVKCYGMDLSGPG
jgi:hypothetical protein